MGCVRPTKHLSTKLDTAQAAVAIGTIYVASRTPQTIRDAQYLYSKSSKKPSAKAKKKETRKYKNESQARAAAKRDSKSQGRFRGKCDAGGHYHVDHWNKQIPNVKDKTVHYRWDGKRWPKNPRR